LWARELLGQAIFSKNVPFIYVRVFHTPAAMTRRKAPAARALV
jgi:hypothetical protein